MTIVSDEDEEMNYRETAKPEVRKGSDEEGKKKKKKDEERGRVGGNQTDSGGSGSSDSESDSGQYLSSVYNGNKYNSIVNYCEMHTLFCSLPSQFWGVFTDIQL